LQSSASRAKPLALLLFAVVMCSQLLLVVEDSTNNQAFSGLSVAHGTPRTSSVIGCNNYWGDESEIKTVEEAGNRTTSGEIVQAYVGGSVLALGTLTFGALAVGGEYMPTPLGLGIVGGALAFAVYSSLNGATRRSGKKIDWLSDEDRVPSIELFFYWPWIKKGEKPSKAGPFGFF